jgi:hypothetical protein
VEFVFIIFTGTSCMDNKLLIVCLVLSFIVGMYSAVMLTKDRGCTVSFKQGNETHVTIGSR